MSIINIVRNSLGNQSQRTKIYSESEILAEIDEAKRKQPQSTGSKPVVPQPSLPIIPSQGAVQPVTFEKAFFLAGDFGKKVNAEVQKLYAKVDAVNGIGYDNSKGVVVGSNPFYVVAVNEVLRKNFPGMRTANQSELEFIAQNDVKHPLKLKGNHYEDSALVWRSNKDPNGYLAGELSGGFKLRKVDFKEGHAYCVPLYSLHLASDGKSPHKVTFVLNDEAVKEYFEAPILMIDSDQYFSSKEMDNNGLPKKVYQNDKPKENRQLWTRNSGLSRLCLNRNLYVNSNYGGLAYSFDNGRVVVVSSESVAKKYGLGGKS